jgi:hypothetical protein
MDADGGELFENTVKTVVLGRRGFPRFAIATPKNRDLKVFLLGHHSSFKKGRCRSVGAVSLIGQPPRERQADGA